MIPKSVSVSTRIVALAVVLFLPVWGLAGEPVEHVCLLPDSQKIMGNLPCVQPMIYFSETDEMIPISCVERMREAIRMMRIVVEGAALDKRVVPNRFLVEHWNQTVKDCVEGR
jgi:hypothetical protein